MGAWKIVRAFFTLARDGGKCSSARPSRLVPENELIIMHRRGTGGRLFRARSINMYIKLHLDIPFHMDVRPNSKFCCRPVCFDSQSHG
jgi:hypothetical protein